MLIYIGTKNDANGNPRRGWIVNYGREDTFFVAEGYSGRGALSKFGISPLTGDVPMIVVTPAEYRAWSKVGQ